MGTARAFLGLEVAYQNVKMSVSSSHLKNNQD
jgi:hypothetical protein